MVHWNVRNPTISTCKKRFKKACENGGEFEKRQAHKDELKPQPLLMQPAHLRNNFKDPEKDSDHTKPITIKKFKKASTYRANRRFDDEQE